VFTLLEGLSQCRGAKLTELAERCGLPVTSTHRLLGELVHLGVVQRKSDHYQLGTVLFELGLRASSNSDLLEASRGPLHDLYADTRQTVHLAVLDGSEILVVDVITGPTPIAPRLRAGTRLPVHATAAGKCLLALGNADANANVILTRVGPRTVSNPRLFAEQMQLARTAGFATEFEEWRAGIASVAAPIHRGETVIGAVSVCGPTYSFKPQQLSVRARAAARRVGQALDAILTTSQQHPKSCNDR
jgi:DNA-binding IclR family transcriptional regulator